MPIGFFTGLGNSDIPLFYPYLGAPSQDDDTAGRCSYPITPYYDNKIQL